VTAVTIEGDRYACVRVLALDTPGYGITERGSFQVRHEYLKCHHSSSRCCFRRLFTTAGDLHHDAKCPVSMTMNENRGKIAVISSGVTGYRPGDALQSVPTLSSVQEVLTANHVPDNKLSPTRAPDFQVTRGFDEESGSGRCIIQMTRSEHHVYSFSGIYREA